MKKRIIVILIFLNLIILIVNIYYLKSEDKVLNNKEHEIVYDNFSNQILQPELILNNEFEGLIYFGRDTCPNCLIMNEFLQNECNKNPNLIIYKFDTDIWRGSENYNMILNKFQITNIPVLIIARKEQQFKKFEIPEEKIDKAKLQDMISKFIYF